MPFALVFIGLVLIVTGAKDTYQQLGQQVVGDFTGQNNFTFWLVSMGAVGSLGYIEALRPFSRAFLALILIAMVIRNGGVFNKFQEALATGPAHPANSNPPADPTSTATQLSTTATQLGQTATSDLNVRAANEPPLPLVSFGNNGPQLNLPITSWVSNFFSQLGLRSTPAY